MCRWSASFARCISKFSHQIGRDQPHVEHDAERNNDQIVEVAKDRNKVRNEVNRADRICDDRECDGFGMPRRSRVAPGDVKGNEPS